MSAEAPDALAHYRDLSGRALHPWVRRGALALLALLVGAALLDEFGQHPVTSNAYASAAAP